MYIHLQSVKIVEALKIDFKAQNYPQGGDGR